MISRYYANDDLESSIVEDLDLRGFVSADEGDPTYPCIAEYFRYSEEATTYVAGYATLRAAENAKAYEIEHKDDDWEDDWEFAEC